jgi:hypothetical protein
MLLSYRNLWLASLSVFILAGSTGAFLRFGVLYGMAGLDYANVRHAHSHLMYFGWVTPALMTLIATQLVNYTGQPVSPRVRRIILVTIGLGVLAYFPFLFYGYRPAEIGPARLPLSVMASFLNVLAWYVFAWFYRQQVRGAPPTRPIWLWNAAVIFLLLATTGALGLPILALAGIQNPLWSMALTHIFLDLFSEGWIILATLGLAYAAFPQAARHPWARRSGELMVAGLPVVFLLYMPLHLVPPALRWLGSVGGLLVVAGVLGNIVALWSSVERLWRVPLVFLALKAITQLGLLVPEVARWAEITRLRVPYLHWLLLGFTTLVLFYAAGRHWSIRGQVAMTIAVLLLTLTLLPLTGLWPPALGGLWVVHAAAWAALGPVIVAVGVLVNSRGGDTTSEVMGVER